MQAQAARTAEAKAAHAALVERASGLAIEIQRLEEAARELESASSAAATISARTQTRHRELGEAIPPRRRASTPICGPSTSCASRSASPTNGPRP